MAGTIVFWWGDAMEKGGGSSMAAVLAGLAVGVAWLGLTWGTGYGTGVLSLPLATLVGLAVRYAAGEESGPAMGAFAAVLAVAILLTGRAVLVPIADAGDAGTTGGANTAGPADEANKANKANEAMVLSMAQVVLGERIAAGDSLAWPEGVEVAVGVAEVELTAKGDCPADVWEEAEERWGALDVGERRQQVALRARFASAIGDAGATEGVAVRIGLGGALWTLLAAIAAYCVAGRVAT